MRSKWLGAGLLLAMTTGTTSSVMAVDSTVNVWLRSNWDAAPILLEVL